MKRISIIAFLFGLFFTILIAGPAGLSSQVFEPYPLFTLGDVLDLFTALILLPLYWLLFQLSPDQKPGQFETILFMALAGVWAMGQGMHLSANAIGHLINDTQAGDLYDLTYFLDENLSHILWHGAMVGLSLLILNRQKNNSFIEKPAGIVLLVIGGILYGLSYAAAILEGGTGLLGVPLTILIALVLFIWGREEIQYKPMTRYFLIAYLLAALVFIGWAIFWSISEGQFVFPEPSEVGLI